LSGSTHTTTQFPKVFSIRVAALASDEAMVTKLIATRATAPTTRKTRPDALLRRPFGNADCTMQKTLSKFLAGVVFIAQPVRGG
jgi:hypothetical protein